MALIELSICKDYVPSWGSWEGMREVFQNAMDENDRGYAMSIDHSGTTLRVHNMGSDLTTKHLLIGFTDKTGDGSGGSSGLRGKHGEGLALGLLALVREGFAIRIETQTENWTPIISKSEKFDQPVLFIKTRSVKQRRNGTAVIVENVSDEMWNQVKLRFLAFHEDDGSRLSVPYCGDLLLNPVYRGQIFVKGIYVQYDSELEFGYNLLGVDLDRDRRMVGGFDLQWAMRQILSSAAKQRPNFIVKKLWEMLNNEAKDVSGFGDYTDTETKSIIAKCFVDEHGEGAIPVSNIGQSEEMESYGARGVVVPRALREVVASHIDTPENIREKAQKATIEFYSWGDLDDSEKANLKAAAERLDRAMQLFRGNHELSSAIGVTSFFSLEDFRVLDFVNVVKFRDSAILGLCDTKNDKIEVSRTCLSNFFMTIRVLIHEVSHKISKAGDATVRHEHAETDLWTAVLYVGDGVCDA